MKSFVLICLCFLPFGLFAQNDSQGDNPNRVRNNEIGFDMTALWRQVLGTQSFGNNDYFMTYRHYMKGFNINAGLGFNYNKEYSDNPGQPNTDNTKTEISRMLNYRIGLEKRTPFFKDIEGMYGLYFNQHFSSVFNDGLWQSAGFSLGQFLNVYQTGLAPFIGIRYNITDRIGIETSSYINFYYELKKLDQFSRYIGPVAGNPIPEYTRRYHKWGVNNQLPIFINITIKV